MLGADRGGEAEEGLSEIEDFPDVSLACSILSAHVQNPQESFGEINISLYFYSSVRTSYELMFYLQLHSCN